MNNIELGLKFLSIKCLLNKKTKTNVQSKDSKSAKPIKFQCNHSKRILLTVSCVPGTVRSSEDTAIKQKYLPWRITLQ